jgi:hypothetical protein
VSSPSRQWLATGTRNAARYRSCRLLIGGLLLLAGLGCTEGEPTAGQSRALPRATAPATVRLTRSTAPPREQPTTMVPQGPDTAEPAEAAAPARHLGLEIEADPDIGHAPLTVQLRALVEGGTGPYTYDWDFGDGGHDTQPVATHTYEEPGAYLATLVVSDQQGLSARQEVGVQVDPAVGQDVDP